MYDLGLILNRIEMLLQVMEMLLYVFEMLRLLLEELEVVGIGTKVGIIGIACHRIVPFLFISCRLISVDSRSIQTLEKMVQLVEEVLDIRNYVLL